ncbi:hypothetical protein EIY87_45115 [Amycolatopsis eburnea]|uniref:Uncharacterized protein n=1 Tax=Amycolatopsis eburnea TaxID=2267691 RepID=A0A3R9KDG1_9PSEU|nr:hypothetical protein [Amycolatopsis eburnea]RSD07962.1 hypothetical protein EIY87_45115 [Amycolatopsis eburnea]
MIADSMDDAGCCLLSVAWNVAPLAETHPDSRRGDLRRRVAAACRTAGHGARAWAVAHGPGTEADYRPFLQLADVAYEIATLLLLVEDFLVPDLEREHRRWAEIEELTARFTELAEWTSAFLLSGTPLRL